MNKFTDFLPECNSVFTNVTCDTLSRMPAWREISAIMRFSDRGATSGRRTAR
ncbi:hypothetical protein MICRO116_750005 [Micrococcus sp. 116]|nr:hypothetical protein MICRO116_750005 [Micrococcus sp. 116]